MSGAKSVFVVDGDPSARTGIARLLRANGYTVHPFPSAEEFLADSDDDASGCLIIDVRMSGLSGRELKAELDTRGMDLPVICVVVDDNPETKRNAQEMRAVGYFRKPVDGRALLDAIEWALEQERRI